ncbi:LysR family transcriptional regulator [Shewanella avicenniae]|uniref:LysR family transcriptional regulator n=1 Tax=Shewanella avicenniae TaxID=2814294 RepID=A0ABX7QMA4_9GAMM|nr:LysR family transcriptional regulator [Shewanella avicenniae]QSX32582.1 LysR family transcriptional regulator [Shewanella avicenniae]
MTSRLLKQLCELDIFTLMVFKNIYETGHANITARELSVSAPKISRCLSALRMAFDDELFYRRQQKLKATPLAETLYHPVCDFIQTVYQLEQQAKSSKDCRADGCLHIAVGYGLMSALSHVLGQTDIKARLGKVRLYKWQDESADLIHSGELDLGITLEQVDNQELISTSLGEVQELGFICREDHVLWRNYPKISIEDIARHPFVYLTIRGFNERIDPLELYCQQENIPLNDIECIEDIEEWYAHLLTMDSVAFAPATELCHIEQVTGLRCAVLPPAEVDKLHRTISMPAYNIIEKSENYRRYNESQRQLLVDIISRLLDFQNKEDLRQFGT